MGKRKEGTKEKGRPTKFKEEYLIQVEKLCKLGATDKEICDFFEIAESTLNLWKLEMDDFSESIKRGKVLADAEVADRLYKRATGYEHTETKLAVSDGVFTDEREITKHYAPDPTAAIFWLKNRQPDKWRDKPEEKDRNSKENDQEFKITIKRANS